MHRVFYIVWYLIRVFHIVPLPTYSLTKMCPHSRLGFNQRYLHSILQGDQFCLVKVAPADHSESNYPHNLRPWPIKVLKLWSIYNSLSSHTKSTFFEGTPTPRTTYLMRTRRLIHIVHVAACSNRSSVNTCVFQWTFVHWMYFASYSIRITICKHFLHPTLSRKLQFH